MIVQERLKVLILNGFEDPWLDKQLHIELKNVDINTIYGKGNSLSRIIRRIHFYTNLKNKSVWYNEWKNGFNDYECIIVVANLLGNEIFSWLRRQGYTGRIICYYRDSQSALWIHKKCYAEDIRALGMNVELWTYDYSDAKKFNMKYNPQFYFNVDSVKRKVEYDAVYVGASRGREKAIISLYKRLKNQGLNLKYIVKRERNKHIEMIDGIEYVNKRLPYNDIIELDKKARCLIEVNNNDQYGLTLRAMESLFYECKLITTNLMIKEMDFYNPNNIFIDGYDSIEKIKEWLMKPYEKVNDDIKNRYLVASWLKRFFSGEKR